MTGTTHICVGALFGVATAVITREPDKVFALAGVVTAATASILPDLDCYNSRVSRQSVWNRIRSFIVTRFFVHRGYIHSFPASLVFTAIFIGFGHLLDRILPVQIGYNSLKLAPYFLVGYLSHLAADSFNPQGINWFPPLTKRKWRIRLGSKYIETDTRKESLLFFLPSAILIALTYAYMTII